MRKSYGARPLTLPQPVFMIGTYGIDGAPDLMNAAWGGVSNDDEMLLCLSADHQTTENILAKKVFTISFATKDTVRACDYVGLVSGKKEANKVMKAGLTPLKSEHVDAPFFQELPVHMECGLLSYDEETCELKAKILGVYVDESVLDEKGHLDMGKLNPIFFDPFEHRYFVAGEEIAKAFEEGLKLR